MVTASCHCGAVSIDLASAPIDVTDCNCSICRRYGVLWAYYPHDAVRITGHPERTAEYVWGDRELRFVRCATCGCVTHWEPLVPGPDSRRGVNMRNADPADIAGVRLRKLDGAGDWTETWSTWT